MNIKQKLIGITTLLVTVAAVSSASAGTAVMGASGHPFNNESLANFSIGDGNVYFTNGSVWMIPIPVPTSTAVVAHTLWGDYGNMCFVQAWSLNRSIGTTYSGVSFSNFRTTINVPPYGSLFFKGGACSGLQARVTSMVLD